MSISDDGNTLAVGASKESSDAAGIDGIQTNNGAGSSGAVYTFIRSGTTWLQQAYIKASNTDAGDQFGTSVALSFDSGTLAVGASGESSNAKGINADQMDDSLMQAGAVYVY